MIQRVNATDLVVQTIRSGIQSGDLKVGDRLPKEADMAAEMGVGRSSLREGIKILHAYGVVESRQGEGTFIVDNRAKNFFEFLGFASSKENMTYFLELRRVIEIGNIIAIYDKLDEETLCRLDSLACVFDKKGTTIDEYIEADKDFHAAMIGFGSNPMIIQVNNMVTVMRESLLHKLFENPAIVEDARVAHHAIVAALRKKDRDACIEAVSKHLDTTAYHIDRLSF